MNVQEFLRARQISFQPMPHHTTYTAQEMAQTLDVPGDNVAKTVVVKADGKHVLTVLQATHTVDLPKLRETLGAQTVELATEEELSQLFSDCELGAVPPFGSEYGLQTIVDESLTHDEHIVFEGNTHSDAIDMQYVDYERIEHPQVADISRHL